MGDLILIYFLSLVSWSGSTLVGELTRAIESLAQFSWTCTIVNTAVQLFSTLIDLLSHGNCFVLNGPGPILRFV